jgi:hypothetical protein
VKELSRQDGFSECEAYAWDMESNFRDSKTFQVRHWRDKGEGGKEGVPLSSERDIYETIANQGARRKRACMEAIIPNDVIEAALRQCQVTLKTKVEITPEFIGSLLENFAEFGITKEMIEKRIQCHITALTPGLAVQLKRIHNSLKDGYAAPGDFFEVAIEANGAAKRTGTAGLREAVVGQPTKENPSGLAAKKGPPTYHDLMDMVSSAREIADKEVALLRIEEIADLVRSLTGQELSSANKAVDAVRQEIKDRKMPKK